MALAINKSVAEGTPEETLSLIQRPEALLPRVHNRSAYLYHTGLKMGKMEKQQVMLLINLAGLPRSLKILESPGIGKRKFQALESP